MNWSLSPVAEALADMVRQRMTSRDELASSEANALLSDEGGVCSVDTVEGLAKLITKYRTGDGDRLFTRKRWATLTATCPEERWVEADVAKPIKRDGTRWVMACSLWWQPHTIRLASYWALRLGAPDDVWVVVWGHLWVRHQCDDHRERICGCYGRGHAQYGLCPPAVIV